MWKLQNSKKSDFVTLGSFTHIKGINHCEKARLLGLGGFPREHLFRECECECGSVSPYLMATEQTPGELGLHGLDMGTQGSGF